MLNLDKITSLYEKVLDGVALRQKLINHNVANLNTPNFRAKRVNFEAALSKAMSSGGDVSNARFTVFEDSTTPNANGNNVNLETEWYFVERNKVMHSIFARALGGTFRALHTAIRGR